VSLSFASAHSRVLSGNALIFYTCDDIVELSIVQEIPM